MRRAWRQGDAVATIPRRNTKQQLAETGNSSGDGGKGMCVREHVKELPEIVN